VKTASIYTLYLKHDSPLACFNFCCRYVSRFWWFFCK